MKALSRFAPAEDAELARIAEISDGIFGWRRWGPYLSERSWGTVREDYSDVGDAWRHLTYDKARAKAYRWGDDGIAGICDRYQLLCFAPAFWNGRDPHLKERLFGLTPWEGNHGEDVKEYYYYSDNTPTHSYMRYLYKYPHQEYPYRRLVEENQHRAGQGAEFELLDTGVFDQNRYWDITIEYAKATPEDLCIRITAANRGPEAAELHILPHLWFRNTWAWDRWRSPSRRSRLATATVTTSRSSRTTVTCCRTRICPCLTVLACVGSVAPRAGSRCSRTTKPTESASMGPDTTRAGRRRRTLSIVSYARAMTAHWPPSAAPRLASTTR